MGSIDRFCEAMDKWCCHMDMHYGQGNSAFPLPRYDFRYGGSTDCTAMLCHCLILAGYDVPRNLWSGNFAEALERIGWVRSYDDGLPPRGAVLLNYANHGAMWDGSNIIEFGADPHEGYIAKHGFYDYPWDCYMVPPADSKLKPPMEWVRRLQAECNAQGFSNQPVDGIPGPETLAGCCPLHAGDEGNITKLMQEYLESIGFYCGGVDGNFGKYTYAGVCEYQKAMGLYVDGYVGEKTWSCILGL